MTTAKQPDKYKYANDKRKRMILMIDRLEADKAVYQKEVNRIDKELATR